MLQQREHPLRVYLFRTHLSSIRQYTSAHVVHTSAYVSIRQHTSAYVVLQQWEHPLAVNLFRTHLRQHTSAYFSIRQHTSAFNTPLPHSPPAPAAPSRTQTCTWSAFCVRICIFVVVQRVNLVPEHARHRPVPLRRASGRTKRRHFRVVGLPYEHLLKASCTSSLRPHTLVA